MTNTCESVCIETVTTQRSVQVKHLSGIEEISDDLIPATGSSSTVPVGSGAVKEADLNHLTSHGEVTQDTLPSVAAALRTATLRIVKVE